MATIHVASGGNFQTALNTAVGGDIITLAFGVTFEGNFTVPNKGAQTPIIITTNSTSLALPTAGYRVNPAHEPLLPKLRGQQLANWRSVPMLQFANGARDYVFRHLMFMSNFWGDGNIVEAGNNNSTQNQYSHMPDNIVFDRCYFHGDPIWGQKRGIYMNGKALTLTCCYFDEIFGVGQDAMCVGGLNGTGPYVVTNNHLEGGAENLIFGGDDPVVKTATTFQASPAATNLGGRLVITTDLVVGQWVGILTNGGTQRRHTTIRSINAGTGDVTWDALEGGAVPDTPGDIRWGTQLTDVTIRRNHFLKPTSWQDPILETPNLLPHSVGVGGGTLAIGTWVYSVQAVRTGGYQNATYYSKPSENLSVAIDAIGTVTVNWDPVDNASKYRVWRVATDGTTVYFETTSLTYTDTGGAGTAGSIPSATKRVVKNLFELKTGVNVQIDSNIFENHWRGSDVGSSIWLKASNPSGGIEHNQTKNVVVEKNIFRHIAGWVNISAIDVSSARTPADWPHPLDGAILRNNLIFDSQDPWTETASVFAVALNNGARNVTIDHNTIIHQRYGAFSLVRRSGLPERPLHNLQIRNNLAKAMTYPLKGQNSPSSASGTVAFVAHTNGTGIFERNGIGGVSGPSNYPANNIYPSNAEFEAAFINYDGGVNGDYRLKATPEGDIFRNQGTDGLNLGCDIDAVMAATYGVVDGWPEVVDPGPPDPSDLGGTLLIFSPVHYQPTSSATAALDIRNSSLILGFDDSVTENAYFTAVMPRFYANQGIEVRIVWTQQSDTNMAHLCVFEVAFDRFNESGQSLDSTSEGIPKTGNGFMADAPGKLSVITIHFTATEVDGILGGDMFRLRVSRLPGDILDTMTGDAQVLRVELRTLPI